MASQSRRVKYHHANIAHGRSQPTGCYRPKAAKTAKGAKKSTLGTWRSSIPRKAAKAAKAASISALGILAAFDVAGWAESAHPPRRGYRPRRLERTRRSVPRARR